MLNREIVQNSNLLKIQQQLALQKIITELQQFNQQAEIRRILNNIKNLQLSWEEANKNDKTNINEFIRTHLLELRTGASLANTFEFKINLCLFILAHYWPQNSYEQVEGHQGHFVCPVSMEPLTRDTRILLATGTQLHNSCISKLEDHNLLLRDQITRDFLNNNDRNLLLANSPQNLQNIITTYWKEVRWREVLSSAVLGFALGTVVGVSALLFLAIGATTAAAAVTTTLFFLSMGVPMAAGLIIGGIISLCKSAYDYKKKSKSSSANEFKTFSQTIEDCINGINLDATRERQHVNSAEPVLQASSAVINAQLRLHQANNPLSQHEIQQPMLPSFSSSSAMKRQGWINKILPSIKKQPVAVEEEPLSNLMRIS